MQGNISLFNVFTFYFTNTSTWRKYNLPVDDGLLQSARCHFIRLTQRTMATVHRESAKIEGILLSLKCFRTTTVSSDDWYGFTTSDCHRSNNNC